MSALLYGRQPPNAVAAVVAWLQPLRRSGEAYRVGDPLPFTLITKIVGAEDNFIELADPVVSVHTLTDKMLGYANSDAETARTHQRMLLLAHGLPDITMPDNTIVGIDYAKVFTSAIPVRYEDVVVLRQIERWTIGLSYVTMSPA